MDGSGDYKCFSCKHSWSTTKVNSTARRIIDALSDDLRKPKYRGNPNPIAGHCYIVSELLYYLLGGKAHGLKPYHIRHEGESHWFLKGPMGVIDATASQFKTPVPYEKARGKGFLTKKLSGRARRLLERVDKKFIVGYYAF